MKTVKLLFTSALIMGFISFSNAQCVPNITTGLVAEYNFSGNANDASGNGNNGTVYGCTLVPDRFGNPNSAYSFNGTSDSIVVPNSSSLQFTSDNQSISFWMKIPSLPNPSLNNEGIFDKMNQNLAIDPTGNSAQGFYGVFGQSGNGQMDYSVKSGSSSPWATATTNAALLNANQWEHIVYIFNSTTDTIYSYLNGALVNSAKIQSGTTIGQNSLSLLIGESRWMNNGNPSYLFDGILDDIRIYDIALSPCDVDSLYNMPNPTLGINEITTTKNTEINTYPNPANTEIAFQISTQIPTGYISIFDMTGRKVQDMVINANKTVLGLTDYPNGLYMYQATDQAGNILGRGKFCVAK